MANIIRIQYEPYDDALSKEDFISASNKIANAHSRAYAEEIKRIFERWLAPGSTSFSRVGGQNPIGASGAASKNFVLKRAKRRGVITWYILEGGRTPANQFIRKGIPPGVNVSLGALKLWAARKGINFLSSSEYQLKYGKGHELKPGQEWTYGKAIFVGSYKSESSKGNQFTVKEHGRSEKGKRHVVNSALKAIQAALMDMGTDRPGANWYTYEPKGRGFFDYPAYLVTKMPNKIRDLNAVYGDRTANAMVSYWNSGGRVRVFDWKMGELGKTRPQNKRGVIF